MAKELTTAEILERARQLMNDNGRHWFQGDFKGTRDGETCFCSIGAIRVVLGSRSGYNVELSSSDRRRASAAEWELRETIVRETRGRFYGIALWNDHPRRTWEQVDKMFRKAIKRAESVEA